MWSETVRCKRTIFYSALQFCITSSPNIFPVVIIYCILRNAEFETGFKLELCECFTIYRYISILRNTQEFLVMWHKIFEIFTLSSWVSVKLLLFSDWCLGSGGSGKNGLSYLPCNKYWFRTRENFDFPVQSSGRMQQNMFHVNFEHSWGDNVWNWNRRLENN